MMELSMPTMNPRVNITFEPPLMNLVSSLAKEEHKSVASLAKELIVEALERREDKVLSALAEMRDKKSVKKIKHEDAWK